MRGVAAHGASPQLGKAPIYIASQIVIALQGIISREKAPNVPGFYFAVGGTPAAAFAKEKNGGPAVAGHYYGLFKVDSKASSVTGATAMTLAMMELLGKL